ncbi:MAG: ABC transporter permease [Lachnospiraceae bacterium]|nr:ABC transporter permease [Lachnospiraceae bacterium]
MHLLKQLFSELKDKRKMIAGLAASDFKKRFVGSYFGVVWMFVNPVVTVLIFFFIFQLGMKSVPPVPDTPYVIWLIPGLVPWFFFNESVSGITNVLNEYNYLVKKVVFPVELLPVIKVCSCFLVHACFLVIMFAVFLIGGVRPQATWIQVLYYSMATLILALGIGFLTSAVNVFFKDMTQIVGICLQFGMWLAPIMYWDGMFTADHPWMAPIFKINPIYYIVSGYRDSMLTGHWFWERPLNTIYFWVVTAVIFYAGLKIFIKLRPHFSDVL